jgi:hypothetical protein
VSLFFFDSSRQALVYVDPITRQGVGFFAPEVERVGYWEPKGPKGALEVAFRKVLPKMPGQSSPIQAAPPGLAAHLKHGH